MTDNQIIGQQNKELLLRSIVILLFFLVIHAGLAGKNMTPDGVIYASVAKHFASGDGSFWFPYSMFNEPAFHHHPPLAFALQGLFYRVLGDHFYVENLYQATMLVIVSVLMLKLWQTRTPSGKGGWLLLLMFFLMPLVSRSFTNNFLENTLVVFTTSAVLCQIMAFRSKRPLLWLSLSAFLIVAALLVKGPVGLFPAASLLVIGLLLEPQKKSSGAITALFLFHLLIIFSLCWLVIQIPDAKIALVNYLDFQLKGTFDGLRPVGHDRVYLLQKLLSNLLIPALCIAGIIKFTGFKLDKTSLTWLLIALMASLPLFLSPRQFSHYLIPALPFYALFFTSLVHEGLTDWRKTRVKVFVLGLVAVTIALSFSMYQDFGKVDNDREEFRDLDKLTQVIPAGTKIGICVSHDSIYRIALYLSRFHSVRTEAVNSQQYVLCDDASKLQYSGQNKHYEMSKMELEIIPLFVLVENK